MHGITRGQRTVLHDDWIAKINTCHDYVMQGLYKWGEGGKRQRVPAHHGYVRGTTGLQAF